MSLNTSHTCVSPDSLSFSQCGICTECHSMFDHSRVMSLLCCAFAPSFTPLLSLVWVWSLHLNAAQNNLSRFLLDTAHCTKISKRFVNIERSEWWWLHFCTILTLIVNSAVDHHPARQPQSLLQIRTWQLTGGALMEAPPSLPTQAHKAEGIPERPALAVPCSQAEMRYCTFLSYITETIFKIW